MIKKVHIEAIGEVTLRKIKTAKRIALKIKQTGEVLVTMPLAVSYNEALVFAESQKEWIQTIHQKVKVKQEKSIITSHQNNTFAFFNVTFQMWDQPKLKVQYGAPLLTIFHPKALKESDNQIQDLLKTAIGNILKLEAKKRLPKMLAYQAKAHSFEYNKLTIRKTVTRWGSCSIQKNINLSVYLMLLPDELIDYVILHELSHTIEMNHGQGFYRIMDKVTHGRTQELRRQLKLESLKWNFLKH